jgi:hypothetical protein
MRRFALPITVYLASYFFAAPEESEPADGGNNTNNGGSLNVSGSPGGGGSPNGSAGTDPGTGGSVAPTGGNTTNPSGGNAPTAGSAPIAGSAPTAGAGPGGGTCMTMAAATGMPLLIDDLEDGNADVMPADGRVGGWYLATDMTGTRTPVDGAPVPAEGGMPGKAIHVSGTGLTGWGASLSVTLAAMNGCYDASKLTGITVMMKGTGSVMVSVLTAAVRAAPEGMRNFHKKQITLTADWTPVTIDFSELMQLGGWGTIAPFDATKIYGIDFGPVAATAPATTAYDFWVDTLSFK